MFSQLIYNTRYRSKTIQVFAGIFLITGVLWLGTNVVANLHALGKDFSFSYLRATAGYDINQSLIEYNNKMSHGRAALVGILNTLLVAFFGCIAATVLGVIAGVLRLSNNWIVNRLMAVYVEAFRNIPLLLWIVLIMAVLSEALPQPKEFRGEDPMGTMALFDSVAVTGRGTYIPRIAFTNSLSDQVATEPRAGKHAVSSGAIDWVLIIAVISTSLIAMKWIRRHANRIQQATGLRPRTWLTQLVIMFVPLTAVLVFLGATFVQPYLNGFNFTEGTFMRNSLIALWLALSLYTGAFIAEIVRSGILAVNKGQTEAARALGLSPNKTLRLVILPQAMRVIIPPLISQYLGLTKNSSLALAVGYMDVRATLGGITINQTGRELEGMLLLGIFYLSVSLLISFVINVYNSSIQLKER